MRVRDDLPHLDPAWAAESDCQWVVENWSDVLSAGALLAANVKEIRRRKHLMANLAELKGHEVRHEGRILRQW